MAKRSEKLRRRQHRKEKKHRRSSMTSELQPPPFVMSAPIPPGTAKMSEQLWQLVEPYLDEIPFDDTSVTNLLTFGMAAWNASLEQGARRVELLAKLEPTIPEEVRGAFREIVQALIRRKEKLFPTIRRPIVSFDLTWDDPVRPYLRVAYALVDI